MDADMTVTVACGDWSRSITYDKDHSPAVRQTVAVPLKAGSAAAETITVTVSHKGDRQHRRDLYHQGQ